MSDATPRAAMLPELVAMLEKLHALDKEAGELAVAARRYNEIQHELATLGKSLSNRAYSVDFGRGTGDLILFYKLIVARQSE